MRSQQTEALLRLGHPPSQSFSEAAEAALGALADGIPGTIVLARLEPDERDCRVIEVRGADIDGVHRGAVLPVTSLADRDRPSADGSAASPGNGFEWDPLRLPGPRSRLGLPLEMSNGRIVGILVALDAEADAYDREHMAMFAVAARLLGHEWETVEHRAELQRLRRRAATGADVDPETGLPNREGFLGLLDHEWRLATRGTVESVLVFFEVAVDAGGPANGDPLARLGLKIFAEVLEGNARTTDRLGRVGEAGVAAVLVGCHLEQAPSFVERIQAALRRVTSGRAPAVELSLGVQPLAEAPSPEDALQLAEAEAQVADGRGPAPAVAGKAVG